MVTKWYIEFLPAVVYFFSRRCTYKQRERDILAYLRRFLLRIYALFGVLFIGLNNVAVYRNGQLLCVSKIYHTYEN